MGLGVLDDKHLEHVPGTALLADMIDARQHRYHGTRPRTIQAASLIDTQAVTHLD